MKQIIAILILTFLLAACSQKPTDIVAVKVGDEYYATDSAASEALADKNSDEEIVCKRVSKTGSRLTTKRCSTRKQIELDRIEDQRKISDNIQHNATRNAINKRGN